MPRNKLLCDKGTECARCHLFPFVPTDVGTAKRLTRLANTPREPDVSCRDPAPIDRRNPLHPLCGKGSKWGVCLCEWRCCAGIGERSLGAKFGTPATRSIIPLPTNRMPHPTNSRGARHGRPSFRDRPSYGGAKAGCPWPHYTPSNAQEHANGTSRRRRVCLLGAW